MPLNPMGLPVTLALLSACYSAYMWSSTPESVPVWWAVDDSPLCWAPRWVGVSVLPVLQFLIPYIVYLVVSYDRFIVKQAGESKQAVAQMIMLPALFLFYTHNVVLLSGAFTSADQYFRGPAFVIGVAILLLIFVGYNMQYIEPNSSVGILTPWTLYSGIVWRKTHAHAGYVLPIFGVALLVCAFCVPSGKPLLAVALGLFCVPYLYLGVFSWIMSGGPENEPLLA